MTSVALLEMISQYHHDKQNNALIVCDSLDKCQWKKTKTSDTWVTYVGCDASNSQVGLVRSAAAPLYKCKTQY